MGFFYARNRLRALTQHENVKNDHAGMRIFSAKHDHTRMRIFPTKHDYAGMRIFPAKHDHAGMRCKSIVEIFFRIS